MNRQVEVLKSQIDSLKHEQALEVSSLKDKCQREVHDLQLENQALAAKQEDRRDRELVRQVRREAEEGKRRVTELLGEVGEMRRERDRERAERAEGEVRMGKVVEEERN